MKKFFDVFPTLKLDSGMSDLFGQTMVERVSATKRKDFLRIYISSGILILKEDVYKVEREMKKQFFPNANMTIRIYERYHLSAQYNPEKLMDVYRDSILLELHEYSPIEYNIFKNADITYPTENQVMLTIEDTVMGKEKVGELIRVLEKIYNERCGFGVEILIDYKESKTGKYKEEDEKRIQMQIAEITRRAGIVAGNGTYDGALMDGEGSASGIAVDGMMAADGAAASGACALAGGMAADGMTALAGSAAASGSAGEGTSAGVGMSAGASASGSGSSGTAQTGSPASGKMPSGVASGRSAKSSPIKDRPLKRSDNPDVIYGRDFEDEAIRMDELIGEIGEVAVRGKVINMDKRELKNERTLLIYDVTDYTDTMTIKLFIKTEQTAEFTAEMKPGAFVKIKGITMIDKFDHELTIGSIHGVKKIPDFTTTRSDNSVRKRVELHCHTKMSDMDGVSEVKDIVKRAYKWGHQAIAITDHGVLQAYPDANHVWEDLWRSEKKKREDAGETPDKQDFFKCIYGVEAYIVDDLKKIVTNDKGQDIKGTFVVFDIETTGFSPITDRIIEIGASKVVDGEIVDKFSAFVNPDVPIPFKIENLTGINDSMVINAPRIDVILPQFLEFAGDAVLVAHNASFDVGFIMENCDRQGIAHDFTYVDTLGMARILLPDLPNHKLNTVSKTLGISLENHHRAVDDAQATAEMFVKFISMFEEENVHTFKEINIRGKSSPDIVKKQPMYHAVILAKNNVGRMNLYRLVSESHLNYYAKRPRIPKSLFLEYREGLLIGSACEAGELYRALIENRSDVEIAELVRFYDYLEIQPLGNNKFMISSEKFPTVNSVEDIIELNRRIVKLGEEFRKPVVATCDVHFLDPEDEIYRRIIMAGQHFPDADDQAPLYFRTTEEMLEEFTYLGSDKAQEIVITNTNMIADMIESMSPVRPDKCPPVIADSDKQLTDICYKKAHEIYGETLPQIVEERLKRELNSIISNGFAVMYIIAQKLVWKSVEDGYLVGSRGSVGSSFVANMAGITEVNSLSPHYLCPKCHYYDFDSDEVRAFSGGAGCDMPDKLCPVCSTPLSKEGFDIPFETFLGFKGDKEPDIDLNFSGEYQSKAHKYTEVIFGYGQTYRAGTIGTLADKTAYGYVKNYYEERGQRKRMCEINRIVTGCTGVRRSTGQHPGGIVVLPVGEDINSFTPVQHPANDMKTDIITTHFDYHSIDHNLLKLDILGHDDPTMIRMLQDLTGIDPVKIPLDDKGVMSLFASTEALGITPEQIGGCKLGCLGIPEFGTEFAMQMVIDAKPKCFTDLVRIAGLAHGTDVWLGNAQTLIEEGKATISTAICCRDDIMIYLIHMGVDPALSFTIMESVRKGKGLKPEWEEAMVAADVPDWYIWSCKKIKYMFPKAHAAAYVMMAWRIAYCKINYPLAFYAAFFSIRASGFSYELMCQGKEHLDNVMADYKRRSDTLSKKEQDSYRDMKIVREMYARGYEFVPIDLFSAKSRLFTITEDNKIMPALSSIDGLGEKAADGIVEAAKDGPFLSKEDFRQRAKVSLTIIEQMDSMGILGELPETNQISLFDFVS